MRHSYATQILTNLRNHKLKLTTILILVLLAKVFAIALPFTLKLIVDGISEIQNNDIQKYYYLPLFAIAYACCFLSTTIFDEAKEYLSEKLIQPIVANVGANAFEKLINLPDEFIISNKSGAVMRDIDRGLKALQSLSTLLIHTIFPTLIELIFVITFCFISFDYWISSVILIGIFVHLTITLIGSERLSKEKINLNYADSESAVKLSDAVTNSETIKLFSSEKYETEEFYKSLKKYSSHAIKFQLMHSRLRSLQQIVISIALGIILIRATYLASINQMTAGEFVLLNALAMQVLLPISFFGSVWKEALRLKADVSKLSELFSFPSPNKELNPCEVYLEKSPSIEFKNVAFIYDDGTRVLSDVSFSIPSGTTTAIVGSSGSGKTTIARLLLGFLEPTRGSIFINEAQFNQVERQNFRSQIGVVPQNVVLFHGTIASNISYGKRTATLAEIQKSAKDAQLESVINGLVKGYETEVGERGMKLSGGERQRLGIARALLNNPKVLILDEASSSLDSISEAQFIQGSINAQEDRTCLIIAHRLSSIMHADQILVIDKGQVVEQGSHESLLREKGMYAALWRAQNY
jgi:ABC-type transport system involved in Fe-S cluster assembly fused permease/ATPase subunit